MLSGSSLYKSQSQPHDCRVFGRLSVASLGGASMMRSTILALLALLGLPGSDEPAAKKTAEISRKRQKDLATYVKDRPFLPGCMAKEIAGEDVAGKPMSL
jgi:hypothetical protein